MQTRIVGFSKLRYYGPQMARTWFLQEALEALREFAPIGIPVGQLAQLLIECGEGRFINDDDGTSVEHPDGVHRAIAVEPASVLTAVTALRRRARAGVRYGMYAPPGGDYQEQVEFIKLVFRQLEIGCHFDRMRHAGSIEVSWQLDDFVDQLDPLGRLRSHHDVPLDPMETPVSNSWVALELPGEGDFELLAFAHVAPAEEEVHELEPAHTAGASA